MDVSAAIYSTVSKTAQTQLFSKPIKFSNARPARRSSLRVLPHGRQNRRSNLHPGNSLKRRLCSEQGEAVWTTGTRGNPVIVSTG
jgi:hypothetical protein